MKNFTKLAITATMLAGAYYLYKSQTEKTAPAVEDADEDAIFEGDFVETEASADAEAQANKFDAYKKKVDELAKKASEKAAELAKKAAEKASVAKEFVEKKVEEYKSKDAAEVTEEALEDAEEIAVNVAEDAEEFVGDVASDFAPAEDPVDPEA